MQIKQNKKTAYLAEKLTEEFYYGTRWADAMEASSGLQAPTVSVIEQTLREVGIPNIEDVLDVDPPEGPQFGVWTAAAQLLVTYWTHGEVIRTWADRRWGIFLLDNDQLDEIYEEYERDSAVNSDNGADSE
jgi:hypothetical protein